MASSVTESSFRLLASLGGVLSEFLFLSFVVGHRWKFVSCVGPDSSGAASGGDDEKEDDALQATIDKSKKVVDMQRNLLHQISERRKLVSSIKDTTPNLDHAKPSANEDYGSSSSVSANTDAIKKEENGNGRASSSSYGKSSLNKEPEANKTSPLGTTPLDLERSKQSSASSPATSPEKEKPSGVCSQSWETLV